MLKVVDAQFIKNKTLKLKFNNGFEGVVDLAEKIATDPRDAWQNLSDTNVFRNFKLAHGTLCWSQDFDIAPEYLYYLANKNNPDLQQQFREWGYLS